jgi:hypothetical protein
MPAMQATINRTTEAEKNADFEGIKDAIASLKRDVGALMESVTGAGRNAAARASDEAGRLYGNLTEQGQHSVKALYQRVEKQPMMSLLIAFALGVIGSRMLSR